MLLLLDQNISHKIVKNLKVDFPGLTHLKFENLNNAEDHDIWNYALKENYTIVTFDADFYELQNVKGFPPKIIWLRFGNATKAELIRFFNNNRDSIQTFLSNEEFETIGCLQFNLIN
ncbi:MAG: DUF5615 family PIN-like protein [Bacteroidota bacterium]